MWWLYCHGWLLTVTMTAGWMKIFSADPRLGFLSAAADFQAKIDSGTGSAEQINAWQQQILNNQINAVVTGAFLLLVLAIVAACGREWWQLLAAKKVRYLHEEPYIAVSVGEALPMLERVFVCLSRRQYVQTLLNIGGAFSLERESSFAKCCRRTSVR